MQQKRIQTTVLAVFTVIIVGFGYAVSAPVVQASGFGIDFSNVRHAVGSFLYPLIQPFIPVYPAQTNQNLTPLVAESSTLSKTESKTLIKRFYEQSIYNSVTNLVNTTTTEQLNLADTGINRLLLLNSSNKLTPLDYGAVGQVLRSNGDGFMPSWATSTAVSIATSSGVFTTLEVGTGSPLAVDSNGRLSLSYSGDAGSANSSGGAIFLNNTNNIGSGIGIFSNAGAEAQGNMINVRVNNSAYAQAAFYMSYKGSSNAVEIVSDSSDTSSNALAVTGNNINDSTLGIIGYELGKGTIKVSHYRPIGLNDNNASAISIDLKGSGTAAQGLYVDSTEAGGTTGNLLRLRNQTIDRFVVNYQGNVSQGGYGYDTTYTKFGNTTNDQFFVGTNGSFRVQRATSNSEAFRVQIAGDSQGRWRSTSDGKLSWGNGSNVQDVTLSRFGVGVLDLAGSLQVTANGAGNALVEINQTGSDDLLTASASGVSKFTVNNGGDLISAGGASWRPLTDSTSALKVANAAGTPFVYFDSANSRIGIGAAPSTAALEVTSGTSLFGATSSDQFFIGTNGAFRVTRSASNSEAFRLQINGDTQGRILGTSDGRLKWGDGASTQDVTLRRGATGILWLDGGLTINNLNGAYDTVIKGASDSNLFRVAASSDKIGIGISNPTAAFHISKNGAGNAAFIVNQTGSNEILSASASGTTKFSVDLTGNLVSAVGAGWKPLSDSTSALSVQTSTGSAFLNFDTTNGRVGVGVTVPTAKFQVSGGDILLDNNQALRMKDSGGTARSVVAYSSGNNLQIYNTAATGVVQIGINNASNTSNIRFFTGANTEKMRIDNAGVGIGATTFGTSATNVLAIANGTVPGSSIVGGVQLYAESVSSSSELRVRDEAGNISTLSPHNFSAIPEGRSEPMAWSFYSQRDDLALNVDMLKTVRAVEALSGQQLAYIKDIKTGVYVSGGLSTQTVQLTASESPFLAQFTDLMNASTKQLSEEVVHKSELAPYATLTDRVWSFVSEVVFQMNVTFQKQTTFLAGVVLRGPLTVNKDTAGTALVPLGATKVRVTFSQNFQTEPVVYLSPVQSVKDGYSLQDVTQAGFTVTLHQPQDAEVQINWLAVMQANGGQSHSQVLERQTPSSPPSTTQVQTSIPTPIPVPTPESIGEVAGTATTSAEEASPSAQTPSPIFFP